jgi:hypothetical protein
MSSPAGPPPLQSNAWWRLEAARLGDGRSKSGLIATLSRPLLSRATHGGAWKQHAWGTAGVNPA